MKRLDFFPSMPQVSLPPSKQPPRAAMGVALFTLLMSPLGLAAGRRFGSDLGQFLGLGGCGLLALGLYGLLGMRSRLVATLAYLLPTLLTAPIAFVMMGAGLSGLDETFSGLGLIFGLISSAPFIVFGVLTVIQWRIRRPKLDWTGEEVFRELIALVVALTAGMVVAESLGLIQWFT